jgi:hypothetical protein
MTAQPLPVLKIARMRRWLEAATASAGSPFTLSEQVQDWGGRRWAFECEMAATQGGEARRLSAFFNGLGGRAGRFLLQDASHIPLTGRGAPIVDGPSQFGATLATSGWAVAPDAGRVNRLRNSTMAGAAVGVLGSGGALPTTWSITGFPAAAAEVLTIGEEDGRPTIRLRLNGTPTGETVFINFCGTTCIAAAAGQVWTGSAWAQVVGGTLSDRTISKRIVSLNSSGTGVGSSVSAFTATASDLTRRTLTWTLTGAGTTFARPQITISHVSGALDVTLKIQAPQFETGNAATTFQPVPSVVAETGTLFSLGTGLDRRMHELAADFTPTPDGAGVLQFHPPLRAAPANGSPVDLVAPSCLVRLAGPVPADIGLADIFRYSFSVREAL